MKKYILNLEHTCCNEGHNIDVEVTEFTKRMQMRIVKANEDHDWFECGIDVFHLNNNKPFIVTNLGVYGFNLARFIRNYLNLKPTEDVNGIIKKIIFSDDSPCDYEYDEEDNDYYPVIHPEYLDDDCIKRITKGLEVVE